MRSRSCTSAQIPGNRKWAVKDGKALNGVEKWKIIEQHPFHDWYRRCDQLVALGMMLLVCEKLHGYLGLEERTVPDSAARSDLGKNEYQSEEISVQEFCWFYIHLHGSRKVQYCSETWIVGMFVDEGVVSSSLDKVWWGAMHKSPDYIWGLAMNPNASYESGGFGQDDRCPSNRIRQFLLSERIYPHDTGHDYFERGKNWRLR